MRSPRKAIELGNSLRTAGDIEGARQAYQRAISSGHPAWSVRAALNLAEALADSGDAAGAIEQYSSVADRRPDDPSLDVLVRRAAVRLEILLIREGDQEAAARVYRRAIAADGTADRASFALNRAYELQRRGDNAAAVASYEEAIDLGDPVLSPRAARMLASLVEGD